MRAVVASGTAAGTFSGVDFSVAGIISGLSLTNVTYKPVAAYGHFGRPELDLPWEKLDKKSDLQVCVIKILADAIYKKCKLK